eukprot:TRINITY_DN10965_c0_g1_i1.p1 TRINITY_DN10965_c0_g1~~TRINITY_DN10965_c0_g1_i1.p1  ORF type:complete len:652 (-),score=102.71 TRINITY_DN10965_c0_g1_i1:21-1976(-)
MVDALPPTISYLGDLPEFIEDTLITTTVTISANHLQTILRTLVVAVQQQGKSMESAQQSLGKQQVQLQTRIEQLQREINTLKSAEPPTSKAMEDAIAKLQIEVQETTGTLTQRIDVVEKRMNEELDQLVTDMNQTIDTTNKSITEELEKLNRAYAKSQTTAMMHKTQTEQDLRQVAEELSALTKETRTTRPAATTVLTVIEEREREREEPPPSQILLQLIGGSGEPLVRESTQTPVHVSGTALATSATAVSHVSRVTASAGTQSQQAQIPAQVRYHNNPDSATRGELEKLAVLVHRLLNEIEAQGERLRQIKTQNMNLSRKADLSFTKEQLSRKVDLNDHTAMAKRVDEAEKNIKELRNRLDDWREELTSAHSSLIGDVFEEKMGNIYAELFRLDRHKCDRIELEEWFSKVLEHTDAPTAFRFRCLSCNRNSGPFVEPVPAKKSLTDFPPNSMFVSSLQYKQEQSEGLASASTRTTADDPKRRKKKPGVLPGATAKSLLSSNPTTATTDPDPNGVARRRLQSFQEWLRTRHAEESTRRLGEKLLEFPIFNASSVHDGVPYVGVQSNSSPRQDCPPAASFGKDGRFYQGVSPSAPPGSLPNAPAERHPGPIETPPPPPTPPPLEDSSGKDTSQEQISRLTALRDSLRTPQAT